MHFCLFGHLVSSVREKFHLEGASSRFKWYFLGGSTTVDPPLWLFETTKNTYLLLNAVEQVVPSRPRGIPWGWAPIQRRTHTVEEGTAIKTMRTGQEQRPIP